MKWGVATTACGLPTTVCGMATTACGLATMACRVHTVVAILLGDNVLSVDPYMAQISEGGENSKGLSYFFKLWELNVIRND